MGRGSGARWGREELTSGGSVFAPGEASPSSASGGCGASASTASLSSCSSEVTQSPSLTAELFSSGPSEWSASSEEGDTSPPWCNDASQSGPSLSRLASSTAPPSSGVGADGLCSGEAPNGLLMVTPTTCSSETDTRRMTAWCRLGWERHETGCVSSRLPVLGAVPTRSRTRVSSDGQAVCG